MYMYMYIHERLYILGVYMLLAQPFQILHERVQYYAIQTFVCKLVL